MSGKDYLKYIQQPPPHWTDDALVWRWKCNSYSVDMAAITPVLPIPLQAQVQPAKAKGKAAKKKNVSRAETPSACMLPAQGQTPWLVSSAFQFGNLKALIDDITVRGGPADGIGACIAEENCRAREFRIGPWVWPFVVSTKPILAGRLPCIWLCNAHASSQLAASSKADWQLRRRIHLFPASSILAGEAHCSQRHGDSASPNAAAETLPP